jgi:DNA-binding FadR family transcriptional regulator
LREALSKLRALGVFDTEHGRGSVVRRLDSSAITQLFPLLLALDGEQTVEQMFEMRQALESRTASYAALRRTDDEAVEILRLAGLFRTQVEAGQAESIITDMEFHMAIARATHNPLFPNSLGVVTEFVKHVHMVHHTVDLEPQASSMVSDLHEKYVKTLDSTADPVRWLRAVLAHEAIAEAIRDQDAERARVEMEAHLRYSVIRILQSGLPAANQKAAVDPPTVR